MELKTRKEGGDGPLYVHFTDAFNRRRRISTGHSDHRLAEVKALDIMREHMVDSLPLEARAKLANSETLAGMLRACYEKVWRKQSNTKGTKALSNKIIRERGHWTWTTITYERLREYVGDDLALEPSTRNAYVSMIRTAMIEHRRTHPDLPLPEFPRWEVTARKDRYVTADEEGIIDAYITGQECEAEPGWAYLRALVTLYIETGMRCSEALALADPKNIRRSGGGKLDAIWLEHGDTKSGKGRLIPLTTRGAEALTRVLAHPSHGKWDNIRCGQMFRRVMRATKLEDITLHTLRHTCASRLVQAGVNIYDAAAWLGHSTVTMTERYAHLAPGHLRGALDALEKRKWDPESPHSGDVLAGIDLDPAEARRMLLEVLAQRSGASHSAVVPASDVTSD
jgi:integrase